MEMETCDDVDQGLVDFSMENNCRRCCSECVAYPPLPEYPPSQWKYEMRREMQEMCPNLYFGSYASANSNKLEQLKAAGFTHIVCVRHVMERRVIKPNFPEHFIYKVVEMNETAIESIIPACMSVCEFLADNLDRGGKILIHGNSGAGSSAILIIAFVMFRYGVSPKRAYNYVQQRRFCIRPTDSFIEQLSEFEPIFRAKQLSLLWKRLRHSPDDPQQGALERERTGLKRTIHDVDEDSDCVGLKRVTDDDSDDVDVI